MLRASLGPYTNYYQITKNNEKKKIELVETTLNNLDKGNQKKNLNR